MCFFFFNRKYLGLSTNSQMLHEADIFLADNADIQGQLKQVRRENCNWKTS